MKNFYKYLAVIIIALGALFGMVGMASASSIPSPTPPPAVSAVVDDPGVVEEYGPPGVIVTTVLTGILMIVRSVNEGRKIDVTTYKERATDAETRSNEEIGKVHKKLSELETKLDEVIADRDEYRNSLEERKAQFTQQILDMEKRHQRELEDMHAALMIEVHTRHKLERLLAEKGIQVPETPPPYTRSMREAVTPEEKKQADQSAISMKNMREDEEEPYQ